jgi:3-hydroxybutyrate dehydrogenase
MKDKVVVITGSTSGIGFGIVSKFAKNGAKLVINGFASESEVNKISADLIALGAVDVLFSGADLSKPSEIDNMFKNVIQKYQRIDVLVNNAGIQFVSPIEDFPPEKWEMIVRVDLIAAFYTIKNVIPIMTEQ